MIWLISSCTNHISKNDFLINYINLSPAIALWLYASLKYTKDRFYVYFFIYCLCGSIPMELGVQINLNLNRM